MVERTRPLLFQRFPGLEGRLGWIRLIHRRSTLHALALVDELSTGSLQGLVKRDDQLGTRAAGNKVRKLEFFLGEAQRQSARAVITSGTADSSHVLATVLYAAEQGLAVTCILTPSPPTASTEARCRMMAAAGAKLVWCPGRLRSDDGRRLLARELVDLKRRSGAPPFVIPYRGADELGALGYVEAAFECAEQLRGYHWSAPSELFVAVATMGTAAGLIVGLRLAGLATRVRGVRVVDRGQATTRQLRRLITATHERLRVCDPTVPPMDLRPEDWILEHRFADPGYGIASCASREAVALARREGLLLDDTYTAKVLAALVNRVRASRVRGNAVLLWNTSSGEQCRLDPHPIQEEHAR